MKVRADFSFEVFVICFSGKPDAMLRLLRDRTRRCQLWSALLASRIPNENSDRLPGQYSELREPWHGADGREVHERGRWMTKPQTYTTERTLGADRRNGGLSITAPHSQNQKKIGKRAPRSRSNETPWGA
jgi:hypothetical protein